MGPQGLDFVSDFCVGRCLCLDFGDGWQQRFCSTRCWFHGFAFALLLFLCRLQFPALALRLVCCLYASVSHLVLCYSSLDPQCRYMFVHDARINILGVLSLRFFLIFLE